jgi:hypothetical protein
MDIISFVHKSVELLFQILGLVEVWTRRSMELSPALLPQIDKKTRGKNLRQRLFSSIQADVIDCSIPGRLPYEKYITMDVCLK